MKNKIFRITCMVLGGLCLLGAGALLVYNYQVESTAQSYSSTVVSQFGTLLSLQLTDDTTTAETTVQTLDATSENIEPTITTLEIQGELYIGLLSIPQLELELPVHETWSYPLLQHTPCVFSGTIADGDLIIAAHNYKAHFGTLNELVLGDIISLLDADGTLYTYQLIASTQISGDELSVLESGEWDLTLFTCLYGDNTQREVYRFGRLS